MFWKKSCSSILDQVLSILHQPVLQQKKDFEQVNNMDRDN